VAKKRNIVGGIIVSWRSKSDGKMAASTRVAKAYQRNSDIGNLSIISEKQLIIETKISMAVGVSSSKPLWRQQAAAK